MEGVRQRLAAAGAPRRGGGGGPAVLLGMASGRGKGLAGWQGEDDLSPVW